MPKGILGSHKSLSHFLAWQRETFAIGPDDRVAQLTALSFDVLLRDVFLPLTSGASLHLPDEAEGLAPGYILPWLARERISVLHTVPALAQSWLADVPHDLSLSDLRWVFFSGEPLQDALIERWRRAFSHTGAIVNLYGPTETTMAKCFHRVGTKSRWACTSGPSAPADPGAGHDTSGEAMRYRRARRDRDPNAVSHPGVYQRAGQESKMLRQESILR